MGIIIFLNLTSKMALEKSLVKKFIEQMRYFGDREMSCYGEK